jgi:hypothetical protein
LSKDAWTNTRARADDNCTAFNQKNEFIEIETAEIGNSWDDRHLKNEQHSRIKAQKEQEKMQHHRLTEITTEVASQLAEEALNSIEITKNH